MSDIVDFSEIDRPSSPNTYLVLPDGFASKANPDAVSPGFAAPAGILFNAVRAYADSAGWRIAAEDKAAGHLEFVAATAVLKFKDDVAIGVFADEGQPGKSKLAVYSRSRVGYHDLGANRKRVQRLLEALKDSTGSAA